MVTMISLRDIVNIGLYVNKSCHTKRYRFGSQEEEVLYSINFCFI